MLGSLQMARHATASKHNNLCMVTNLRPEGLSHALRKL